MTWHDGGLQRARQTLVVAGTMLVDAFRSVVAGGMASNLLGKTE